jgi:4-amino-4-deoxy-L-arabinose transferase-like glycosyltransferase
MATGSGRRSSRRRAAVAVMPKSSSILARAPERLAGLGFDSPAALVIWTIGLGTSIRLLFAATVPDLGHSEAYYIATARHLALSYFDHPPLSFWIAWAAMKLTGSDTVLVVRAPFILMFVATTWLMFRLTASLFGEKAGAFAALLLNISPLFAISLGAWVQPDGPLILCLLAATYCIVRLAFGSKLEHPNLIWAQAGAWLGLGLQSKYYAVLLVIGIVLFALTDREYRRWFREPGPYLACAIAILIFSPVLIWNWQNDWISFGFQGQRVIENRGISLRWLADSILGQAALIGPWIWIPMLSRAHRPCEKTVPIPRAGFCCASLAFQSCCSLWSRFGCPPAAIIIGRHRDISCYFPCSARSLRKSSKTATSSRNAGCLRRPRRCF